VLRAVVQRVSRAGVRIDGQLMGAIGRGLVILLGVGSDDEPEDALYMADKIAHLRVFEDGAGKMNRSVLEAGGEVLTISQFTLYGDCRRGRRPSFSAAAPPSAARRLYETLIMNLRGKGIHVATGEFQTHMVVEIINDGPVTILLDSKKEF
jgi:D-tyrosyl-tRNA(Tyr) deacylase